MPGKNKSNLARIQDILFPSNDFSSQFYAGGHSFIECWFIRRITTDKPPVKHQAGSLDKLLIIQLLANHEINTHLQ